MPFNPILGITLFEDLDLPLSCLTLQLGWVDWNWDFLVQIMSVSLKFLIFIAFLLPVKEYCGRVNL